MTGNAPSRTDRFAILLDGDLTPTARLRARIEGARVVAADGGMRHAQALGVTAERWVGDFDSAPPALMEAHDDVPRERHPARKAVADGELAIDHALDLGARELVLCGALGGQRSDHMLFTLLLAIRLAETRGIPIMLSSGREEAVPLLPGKTIETGLPDGTLFSIIPFSKLTGLTISDAQWPLDAVDVEQGSTLTLSNIARQNTRVTLRTGTAALLSTFAV